MTAKKKTAARRPGGASAQRKTTRRRATARPRARTAARRGAGRFEKDVKAFAERLGIDTRQAARMMKEWNHRIEQEVKKASRQIDSGVTEVQKVVKKERRALGRMIDDAVQRALASLNIPSRQEVQALTRKVHQLSRKVDRFGR